MSTPLLALALVSPTPTPTPTLATTLPVDPNNSVTGNFGPGLTAFLIVAALAVVTFLLARSMLNQVKKVPPTFDEPPAASDSVEPEAHDEPTD